MKTVAQKINEVGDFLHEAFCIDGTTEFCKHVTLDNGSETIFGALYKLTDIKRGEFYIAMYKTKQTL